MCVRSTYPAGWWLKRHEEWVSVHACKLGTGRMIYTEQSQTVTCGIRHATQPPPTPDSPNADSSKPNREQGCPGRENALSECSDPRWAGRPGWGGVGVTDTYPWDGGIFVSESYLCSCCDYYSLLWLSLSPPSCQGLEWRKGWGNGGVK